MIQAIPGRQGWPEPLPRPARFPGENINDKNQCTMKIKTFKPSGSFHRDARDYITRLMNLQRHMPAKYQRADMGAVHKCMEEIGRQLSFYPYDTDQKMSRYWCANRNAIRLMLPTNRHPAFAKMIAEFERFDTEASAADENAVWIPVVNALCNF
jgi:hypothetical protein